MANTKTHLSTEQSDYFKLLMLNEIEYRKKFRDARAVIEELVSPITRHNRECCQFWSQFFPEADEVVIIMDNGDCVKIVRPTLEECSVETYLPFGIDFKEHHIVKVNGVFPELS